MRLRGEENAMTCSCGRFQLIDRPTEDDPATWGDWKRFPHYVESGVCPDCGDVLNRDGTVQKRIAGQKRVD